MSHIRPGELKDGGGLYECILALSDIISATF